jgi:hypothetical protein
MPRNRFGVTFGVLGFEQSLLHGPKHVPLIFEMESA